MRSSTRNKSKRAKLMGDPFNNEPAVDSTTSGILIPDDIVGKGSLPALSTQKDRRPNILRKPPPATFGAIDVGTNSIHLVMVEISPQGDFRILGRDKEMVQIGKGGFSRHVLTARAMNEGLSTLKRFVKMSQFMDITRLKAVATSAVREARNGGDFVNRVRHELGLELHVISAEHEARLIYLAVRHAVDLGQADNLIIDIGGGSVELIVGNAHEPHLLTSAKLGASRLAELFMHSDPPAADEIKAMRRHVEDQLAPVVQRVGPRRFAQCIATSGTVENIATICAYRRGTTEIEPVTQLRITRDEIKNALSDFTEMTREQRTRIAGIDTRRIDSLIPAMVLLLNIMRSFEIEELRHCDMALREGIILDHIARHRAVLLARATWPDPRTRSVIQLAERCAYRQAHAEQVARLALMLYDQLHDLHQLEPIYRDLLRHACILHDIGYLIGHENHHKHSYYLIRNGGLQGFSEQEIEIIANIARYHRKGRPKKEHYSYQNLAKAHRSAVRKLVALLRVANALDRTHCSTIDTLTARVHRNRVELQIHTEKDAELELWTARRQEECFERAFDRAISFVLTDSEMTKPEEIHS